MPDAFTPRRVTLPARVRVRAAAALALPAVALALWGARAVAWGPALHFLVWNLFLASVPWVAAHAFAGARGRLALAGSGAAWLLFLPNAPYLVTDLVHLRPRAEVPHSYDVLLFAAFALAGCVLGWASLEVVHRRLVRTFGRRAAAALVAVVLLLTGFGVYLGRFLRWNSWDVVARPGALAQEAIAALANPRALAFSALFATLLGAGYVVFNPPRVRASRS